MWQPIETAPKDETLFWAIEDGSNYGIDGHVQYECWWVESRLYAGGGRFADRGGETCFPSHWMPLPEPPK